MNPEFTRNAWLELTPLRLWALPLVVVALAVVVNAFGHEPAAGLHWESLRGLGIAVFSVFAVWGGHKAAQSVTGEVAAGTWDLQRLAQHRPFELLVGKLLGSTVFDWLGIALGLALFAVASAQANPVGAVALDVVTLALGALWLHALGLFASLATAIALRSTRRPTQGARQSGTLIVLLLLSLWLGPAIFRVLATGELKGAIATWWWSMPVSVFAPLSIAMFLFWTLLGAHRLIRAELQEPVSPLPWIGFMVFLTAYVFPFAPPSVLAELRSPVVVFLGLGAGVTGVLFYPLLLGERKDVVRLRSLAAAWTRGDARAVWTRLPLWTFTIALYALCVAGLGVCGLVWRSSEVWIAFAVALSFGLFMARDIGWILAVHLAPNPGRRPDWVVIFFLAVLYGLIPVLLSTLGDAGTPGISLFVPGSPVVHAAKEAASTLVASALWALPGVVVAWAIAAPRLLRALGGAHTASAPGVTSGGG